MDAQYLDDFCQRCYVSNLDRVPPRDIFHEDHAYTSSCLVISYILAGVFSIQSLVTLNSSTNIQSTER